MSKIRIDIDWGKVWPEDVIERFPRLVSHMICESLGYFTPTAAANAVIYYKRGLPFWCEWYVHIAGGFNDARIREAGVGVIKDAIARRHLHTGYMADYNRARAIVEHVRRGGQGPEFASWF